MRKKIDVTSLEVGMYVAALDRPWLGTPFLFQGFEVRGQDDIESVRQYCSFVYIDIPEQFDAVARPRPVARPIRIPSNDKAAPVATDADRRYEHDVLRIVNRPTAAPVYSDQTTLEQEIGTAQQNYHEIRETIDVAMEDARLGRAVNSAGAKKVIGAMVESIIRNPDALMCFTCLKKKDEYAALHGLRSCILALAFGRHMGWERSELQMLGLGALFHDIGYVKIPSEILNKHEPLTATEFALMRRHVKFGVDILEQSPSIATPAIEVVRGHHERYDGGGYPAGLKGDSVGLFGMIGGIVDCYDAMTSERPHRAGVSSHIALRKMYDWRGRDFHPQLVEQFIQCMGIYPIGSLVELSTGEVGVVVTVNRLRRLKPRVAVVLKRNYAPYGAPRLVDLAQSRTEDGVVCDIERVLEPGAYGINPLHYLPVSEPRPLTSLGA